MKIPQEIRSDNYGLSKQDELLINEYIKIHPESINDMDSTQLKELTQYLNRIKTNNTRMDYTASINQPPEDQYHSMHNQDVIELDSNVLRLAEYMSGAHDNVLVSTQYAMLPDQMVAPLVTLSYQIV
ncbi:hypothetical protein [Yersinia alsatica]|uniref:hypothetical protein n=1 Tax=Yersinia alsatica TaxID=2890317 RepID=UPI0011A070AF|nr:hypothetical protein [Yersinia alsatica]